MRMLILTLASGEAGLPLLREQIARQSLRADHEVIEGLANREAHAALHRTVMERSGDYDLFFKIDADMSFRRDSALEEIVAGIAAYPQVRHFLFPVYDCFTEQEIRGVSLYRSGVRWESSDEDLFVDPAPVGARAAWCGGSAMPFINHGEAVSDFECFSFGVHKTIKLLQRGRTNKKVSKQSGRLLDLARVRRLCRETGKPRHWETMRGVAWALREGSYHTMDSKAALQASFEALGESDALDGLAQRLVLSQRAWLRMLAAELGWGGVVRALLHRPPAEKARSVWIERPLNTRS